jgi:hypothetical protein
MSISYSSGLYTLSTSGSYTPADLYAYSSSGITRHTGSRIIYDFGSSRITVGSGTTLTIDTDDTYGEIMFSDPGWDDTTYLHHIKVDSGGTLNLGSTDTRDALIVMKDTTALNYKHENRQIYISGEMNWTGGGLVFLEGGSIEMYNGSSGEISGAAWLYAIGEATGIRYSEGGFDMLACSFYFGALIPFVLPDGGGSFAGLSFFDLPSSQPTVGIDNDGSSLDWMPCEDWDVSSSTLNKAFGYWDNRAARFINQATGTDFEEPQGNLADNSNNKGILEVRESITFSATNGSGAKFYTEDTDNGNRLAASQILDNPSYTADRTYTLTESSGEATYDTDGGVLTGVYWRTTGGLAASNNNFDSRGNADDTTDIFTWLKVEYGYQPATLNVVMKGNGGVSTVIPALEDAGITESTRATVAAYSMAYNNTTKVLTISDDYTANDVYDYMRYIESENPDYVWNNSKTELVSLVQPGKYDLDDIKIVITSGGTLTVDTDTDVGALVFGDRTLPSNAITVESGGELVTGQAGSLGTSITFNVTAEATQPAAFEQTYANINVESGGTWTWVSTTIDTHVGIYVAGTVNISGTASLINSGEYICGALSPYVRMDSANLTINGFETNSITCSLVTQYSGFAGVTFKNALIALSVAGAFPADTWAFASGLDFTDVDNQYDVGYFGNRWFRLSNLSDGTDIVVVGNSSGSSSNKGLVEVRQAISFTATSGAGAKFYTEDTDNGNRLAASQIGTNPSYTADRTYTLTESSGTASYTTDGGVLTGVHWRDTGGLRESNNEFDSRGTANDNTDIFNWLKVRYGYQPATLDVIMKGTSAVQSSIAQLVDLGITESTKATVAAYTGITPVYATGTLTVTVDENHTINEVYDYIKYYESENPDEVWANSKESFISTSNKLTYTYSNLVIVVDGVELTGSVGQILPTKPTVSSGGFFEDAEGAIWEDSGSLYYAKHVYRNVVDLDTSTDQQYAVVACWDTDNDIDVVYNTSLVNGALTTDAGGDVECYFVYKKDSTTYTLQEQILCYGFNPYVVPVDSNGNPIGASGSYATARLVTDDNITLNRTNALAVSGITVNHTTEVMDISDEEYSPAQDNLKARQFRTNDIETGKAGYESYYEEGLLLAFDGSFYTAATDWIIQNSGFNGTLKDSILELDTADTYNILLNSCQVNFEGAGTYDLRGATITTDITVDTIGDYTVTVQVPTGTSVTNNDAVNITVEASTAISISNANLIDDTRVRLYNTTQDAELDNSVVSGGGGYSYNATVGAGEEIEVGDTITIYATYNSGTTYKENYTEAAVASTSNMVFIGTQSTWTAMEALGYNGSNQTEYTADYPNIEVDVDASGNAFKVGELIAWIGYIQTTEDGIRNFYGAISGTNAANWVVDTSVVDLFLDNTNAATATQEDEVILMRDDSVYPQEVPTSGGGGIGMIQSGLVFTIVSGSGVTEQDKDDIIEGVWDYER